MTTLRNGYETRHPWPADCFVQGGGSGLVIRKDGSTYGTAFVEAFAKNPQTFLRGEGATLAEAEDAAWAKYQRITAGDHEHEFEARGYRNGAGFCKHCGLFQTDVFDLAAIGSVCTVCGVGTYWCEVAGALYCEAHAPSRKEQKGMRQAAREAAIARGEEVPFSIAAMFEALLDENDEEEDEDE